MSPRPYALPQSASLPPVSRMLVSVALALAAWDDRRRTRTSLARLDTHLLNDIGLGAERAATECAKPFWRD